MKTNSNASLTDRVNESGSALRKTLVTVAIVGAGALAVLLSNKTSPQPYHTNLYFRGFQTEAAGEGRFKVRQVWQRQPLSTFNDFSPIEIYQESNLPTAKDDQSGNELVVGKLYHVNLQPRVEGFYTVRECKPVIPGYVCPPKK